MGQAKDAVMRQKVIEQWRSGASYAALSRQYGFTYNTVRNWCCRYQAGGDAGLLPNYAKCGRRVSPEHEKLFRLVRLTKHLHPGWGIPYIVQRIEQQYPDVDLQSIRHYQRRLSEATKKLPKATLPKSEKAHKSSRVHQVWEIDANERLRLREGQGVCYLNITDEKSGAILKAQAFSPAAD